jgi:uncharacterized protein (DUF2126 family)
MSWFDAFFEFRFPHYGTVKVQNIEMEIRSAIEPWHVLGEEMSSSGTARYVDSSLERVQVKLRGLNGDRYILLCNGTRVPLRETHIKEEFVCGVRYRAWQPPSALHPTIGVDTPLTFDIIDTWNSRSIGGCTYHVSHPGGRHYNTFPVNAYEAESRRGNRFEDTSYTQDVIQPRAYISEIKHYVEANNKSVPYDPPPIEVSGEYPNTLDMRQFWKKKK